MLPLRTIRYSPLVIGRAGWMDGLAISADLTSLGLQSAQLDALTAYPAQPSLISICTAPVLIDDVRGYRVRAQQTKPCGDAVPARLGRWSIQQRGAAESPQLYPFASTGKHNGGGIV